MPPRASVRQRNATPARSTRNNIALPQDTLNAQRSTRATSRQPAAKDVVSNPALPEIQTQQSYAYGSSKTPALPEQLHARNAMSMRAVASRLQDAADEAERNFEAHAAEVRGSTPESQLSARDARAHRRASKEASQRPSPRSPSGETLDEVRKEARTAAWVTRSRLDDISEEGSRQDDTEQEPETPARNRQESLLSSFPSGSFNHSYNYERGEREPRLPQPEEDEESTPRPTTRQRRSARSGQMLLPPQGQGSPMYRNVSSRMRYAISVARDAIANILHSVWQWMFRMIQTVQKSILELPDSPAVSILVKAVAIGIGLSLCGLGFCTVFTWTCDASSPSVITQTLQSLCGQCTSSSIGIPLADLSTANTSDIRSLLTALQQTQSQIRQIESRLNSRIDSSQASHSADAAALRQQQDTIEFQIRRLSQNQADSEFSSSSFDDIPSPLMPQINFFSPSNGAIILHYLTSPTRAQTNRLARLAYRILRIRKTVSPPPITALESWLDEGDCWCAAEHAHSPDQGGQQQDSIRLGVQTSQLIYPTELVIEHFPSSASLEPGTAPHEVELWADFSTLAFREWEKLHIQDLISESPLANFLPSNLERSQQTWARIGVATYTTGSDANSYEMGADEYLAPASRRQAASKGARKENAPHIQRFNLQVNQNGLLHYANRFLLRVRSNHGAPYTCLYRVRLHGLPFNSEEGSS